MTKHISMFTAEAKCSICGKMRITFAAEEVGKRICLPCLKRRLAGPKLLPNTARWSTKKTR